MRHRLSYASVTATLALLLAVGGTTAVGAQALLTGRAVKDESLTGADIQNDSLTGADIRAGSLGSNLFSGAARANLRGAAGAAGPAGETGATGLQGPAGAGVTTTTATGADAPDYQDFTPLATATLTVAGDWVVFASVTAHNTGGSDDNLNCGLFIDGNQAGGGGAWVTAGSTVGVTAVGAIPAAAPAVVTLKCTGNSVTTFDLSDVTMRMHNLG